MRLIDADALIVSKRWENCTCPAQVIHSAPTIDYKDLIPQGKWEKAFTLSHDRREVISVYKCSICNVLKGEKTSFCPDCGAKMLNN